MDQVLYVQSVNVKFDSIIGFRKWLAEVKWVDDDKWFECLQAIKAFEQSTASSHATSTVTTQNVSQGGTLTGPSCKGPCSIQFRIFIAETWLPS
jgi:hypothetical protein